MFWPQMRDASIKLWATPEQRDLIDQAAELLGRSLSEFMLGAACERAWEVVMHQVSFSLDEHNFQQLTALLDVTQEPNAGLERLLSVRAPWDPEAE